MKIANKEIKDECQYCGEVLQCVLFRQGHGIKQERCNITEMLKCQFRHKEERKVKIKPAIWTVKNPEGLYCPDCGCFMKDYYNPLEKCPNCGQRLEGWIDGSDKQKSVWKQWSNEYK